MKRAAIPLLLCAVTFAAGPAPKLVRVSLMAVERSVDSRVERMNVADPFTLLGTTRGIYLEGYGAVFTTEVNLVGLATISPFRPAFTKAELANLKQKKQERLVTLKQNMRQMLLDAAPALETVPESELIVVGVNIFYFRWEDSAGLPTQVVMRAPRQALLTARQANGAGLDAALRVQEY
ncbi:MAG: hypothetical protein HYZ57_10845 [Acidobacteria bacterium]|nr:hypothetical protein [Acidobacteriota bacterium]MBI3280327.1 hypothetical protein [Acidobacteriota bacterium]